MSDTSVHGTSVPVSSMTVKKVISSACAEFPVVEREYALVLSAEITDGEVSRLLSGLWFAEQRVLVRVRFKVGDIWNQLHTGVHKKLRKSVMKLLAVKMTDEQYRRTLQRLSNYAWVARKWCEELRHDHKPWSFFVENAPEGVEKPEKGVKQIPLRIMRRYVVDGVEYIECMGRSDREYLACELPGDVGNDTDERV